LTNKKDSVQWYDVMNYKPYSAEWHRYRYLKESIDKYLDDGSDPSFILNDIRDILRVRSEAAYQEFNRINKLENYLTEE
jgi:hypothetical protein